MKSNETTSFFQTIAASWFFTLLDNDLFFGVQKVVALPSPFRSTKRSVERGKHQIFLNTGIASVVPGTILPATNSLSETYFVLVQQNFLKPAYIYSKFNNQVNRGSFLIFSNAGKAKDVYETVAGIVLNSKQQSLSYNERPTGNKSYLTSQSSISKLYSSLQLFFPNSSEVYRVHLISNSFSGKSQAAFTTRYPQVQFQNGKSGEQNNRYYDFQSWEQTGHVAQHSRSHLQKTSTRNSTNSTRQVVLQLNRSIIEHLEIHVADTREVGRRLRTQIEEELIDILKNLIP